MKSERRRGGDYALGWRERGRERVAGRERERAVERERERGQDRERGARYGDRGRPEVAAVELGRVWDGTEAMGWIGFRVRREGVYII